MTKDFPLSKNFSFYELTKTSNPVFLEENRLEGLKYKVSLGLLTAGILQPIRDYWQKPVIITSGFRCANLNKAIGGVFTSQHILGEAADFIVKDIACEFIFENLRTALPNILFGQFIWENKNGKEWLHISLPSAKHKLQMLIFRNDKYEQVG